MCLLFCVRLFVCLFTLSAFTGAINQITWCKHSFLFWSRHLSHPTRNSSEPRWLKVGCINLTTDTRSGFLIGTWVFSPGRYIPVVTAPWVPTCGAVPMWRLIWGTGIVLQSGVCCSWHGFCITSIFSSGLIIEALNSVFSGYGQSCSTTDSPTILRSLSQRNICVQIRYDATDSFMS